MTPSPAVLPLPCRASHSGLVGSDMLCSCVATTGTPLAATAHAAISADVRLRVPLLSRMTNLLANSPVAQAGLFVVIVSLILSAILFACLVLA